MSKNNKFYFVIGIVLALAVILVLKIAPKEGVRETVREIYPTVGTIENIVSTTGIVLPKNRLEIKPPVGGRIESILVKEGDKVKTGQTLAWMSSTERAALLDAARGQSEEKLKYWQEAYKPIALLSPIDGEVIVATTQPGQTLTANDAAVVLSDHLIVRAQVDETDIGKIKLNQDAVISLDAYPETKIKAKVEHIYYESKTVNNVTIYEVDLAPEGIPAFFRSGMNASIDFVINRQKDALLIPQEAVQKEGAEDWVFVAESGSKEAVKRKVQLGISSDKNVQVISGLTSNDKVVIKSKKYALPQSSSGSNPFMPFRKKN